MPDLRIDFTGWDQTKKRNWLRNKAIATYKGIYRSVKSNTVILLWEVIAHIVRAREFNAQKQLLYAASTVNYKFVKAALESVNLTGKKVQNSQEDEINNAPNQSGVLENNLLENQEDKMLMKN